MRIEDDQRGYIRSYDSGVRSVGRTLKLDLSCIESVNCDQEGRSEG